MELTNKQKIDAEEKIRKYKKFYKNLTIYILVNFGLILLNLYQIYESQTDFNLSQLWVVWVILGWGLGIFFNYLSIKGFDAGDLFLGKGWEEKEIQKIIDKDKKQT